MSCEIKPTKINANELQAQIVSCLIEELYESKEKFLNICATARDAIMMIDNEGNISYWNKAAERIFGFTSEEAIGKELHTFIVPRKYNQASKKGFIKLGVAGQGAMIGKTLELTALNKDGTEFPVEISASAIKIKGLWHYIGVIRDITRRKGAEEELRKYRKHLEDMVKERTDELLKVNRQLRTSFIEIEGAKAFADNIISSMAESVIVVSPEGVIQTVNQAACDLIGYTEKELVKMHIRTIFEEEEEEEEEEAFKRSGIEDLIKKGFIRNVEKTFVAKDGKRIPVLFSGSVMRYEDGRIQGIVCVATDITERKLAEEGLEHYSKKLIELQESERKRIASELHDSLGTSLITVKSEMINYLDVLPARAKNIEGLETAIDTIDQIIEDVRKISHDLRPPQLDILGLTGAVKSMAKKLSHASGIEIRASCKPNDLKIPQEIEINLYRIIQEGLTNILKHSNADKALVKLNGSNGFIELQISDNGKGFKIKSINLPFDTENGFGLQGMSERTKIMGGSFKVDSKPGKGTMLTVTVRTDGIETA